MAQTFSIPRRQALAGLVAAVALTPALALAKNPAKPAIPPVQPAVLRAEDFGVEAGGAADQTSKMQAAIDRALELGQPLLLPGGPIRVQNLGFPGGARLLGVAGRTVLVAADSGQPIGRGELADNLWIDGVSFVGTPGGPSDVALFSLARSAGATFAKCQFKGSNGPGLLLQDCAATITDCSFDQLDIAIFSHNSRGLMVTGNRISNCSNGGVLIWRDEPGPDGSIITGNRISGISAKGGGSGENGNAINMFKADNVIAAENVIDNCDFSAIRANSTRNAQIRGNTCTNLRECAIWSEFGFSGSVISNNIIDGAAAGISITNLDQGGQLAVCSGNIVRNIADAASANTRGIYVEADTVVAGNTVQTVSGFGVLAGTGPFLRNVLITGNVISAVKTGIGVSVVPDAGQVRIAGNMITGAAVHDLAGMAWDKEISGDLVADLGKFPNVTVADNTVGP